MKLLLAEDTADLSKVLCAVLTHEGYDVDPVFDGEEAMERIRANGYDCLILDIMMPKKDGIEVLREVRAKNIVTPVLMLTAKSEIDDRVAGLDAGADDYLTKPFAMKELLARIRSMTRRQPAMTDTTLTFGDLTLRRSDALLGGPEGEMRLANKEFQVMEMMMTNSGQVIPTERFLEKIWGYDSESEINVVWVNISGLRKKIAELGAHVRIKAARGVGYLLEEIKE